MSPVKIILYIIAVILIFFGVLFIWSVFSPDGQSSSFFIGAITVAIGLGLIWLAGRQKPSEAGGGTTNVNLKIDLPANVKLDTMKCKSCGGDLTLDNVKMVAGAPVVNCPYCNTTYQLTEEPKW